MSHLTPSSIISCYAIVVLSITSLEAAAAAHETSLGPTNLIAKLGDKLDLTSSTSVDPTTKYQWFFKSVVLPGQTNASLRFSKLQYSDMGTYVRVASNSLGTVSSGPVNLIVNAVPIRAGSVDPSFDPGTGFPDGEVSMVINQSNKLIVGGKFRTFNGIPTAGVARLFLDGELDTTFSVGNGPPWPVQTLAIDGSNRLLIGTRSSGSFQGIRVGALTRVDSSGTLDPTYNPLLGRVGCEVWSLLSLATGKIFVSGACFDAPCSRQIVRLNDDGTEGLDFSQDDLKLKGNRWIRDVGFQSDGRIIVAGGAGGGAQGVVARLLPDGSIDATFQAPTGFTWTIAALKVLKDDRILLGFGGFSQKIPPMNRSSDLVVLDANGGILTNFASSLANDGLSSITQLPDESILVGGRSLKRIKLDGTLDTNFVCVCDLGAIRSILVQSDGNLIIGGDFKLVNGSARSGIARVFGTEQVPQPIMFEPSISVNGFAVRFPTIANREYNLEATSKIGGGGWTRVQALTGDGNWQSFSDPPGIGPRFYRLSAD